MTEADERRAKIGRVGLLMCFVLLSVVTISIYRLTARLSEGLSGLERRERVLIQAARLEKALAELEADPCGSGEDRAAGVLRALQALGGIPGQENLRNLEALVQEELESCNETASSTSAAEPNDPARSERWAVIRQRVAHLREGDLSRLGSDLDAVRQAARLAGPLAFLASIATFALLVALLGLMSLRRPTQTADAASKKVVDSLPQIAAAEISSTTSEEGKAQARFLSSLSHELRTPLNAIGGFGELLASGAAGPLSEKQERFVQNIRSASARLLELADDVRDLALIESGTMELKREFVRLAEVVGAALAATRETARSRRVQVASSLPAEPLACYADAGRLRQALERLLHAALRAASEGDELELTIAASGDAVEIRVDQKVAARFPEISAAPAPSTGTARSTSEIPAGAALEMTLARRLTELQGGTLEVSFDAVEGRKFKMRLPWHKDHFDAPRESK